MIIKKPIKDSRVLDGSKIKNFNYKKLRKNSRKFKPQKIRRKNKRLQRQKKKKEKNIFKITHKKWYLLKQITCLLDKISRHIILRKIKIQIQKSKKTLISLKAARAIHQKIGKKNHQ